MDYIHSITNKEYLNIAVINKLNQRINDIVNSAKSIFNYANMNYNTTLDHSFWLEFYIDDKYLIEATVYLAPIHSKNNKFSTNMKIDLYHVFYDNKTNHKIYKKILKYNCTVTNTGFDHDTPDPVIKDEQLYGECLDTGLIKKLDEWINKFTYTK